MYCRKNGCLKFGTNHCKTCREDWCLDHLDHDHFGSSDYCHDTDCNRKGKQYCFYCKYWWCSDHIEHGPHKIIYYSKSKLCNYNGCNKFASNPHNYCLSHFQIIMKK